MKVVAYNGSPRVNGNTSKLIQVLFEELNKEGIETVEVNVGKNQVNGCIGCGRCKQSKSHECLGTRDVFNEYYKEAIDADGIVLASPVYFADVTGQMKCFIDRFGSVARANGILKGKVGASIVTARRDGGYHTYSTLNAIFGIGEMINVGSTYWNLGVGRAIGEVLDDEEGLATIRELGKNMAKVLKQINE